MNKDLFPNLFPSNVIDHPNKKDFSDNGIIKVNIPVLYVLFEQDFTNSNFESQASQLVSKLRITLDRVKAFYLENSYGKFIFEFKVKTTLISGNYQIAFDYSHNALTNVLANDPMYPWDDNITFAEFLDFGIPLGDTHAFVLFFAKVDLTWGGVRNYNTPKSKFSVLGHTLNQFVCVQHTSISELEPNGRGWTITAHELAHTLRTPDLYNMNAEGFLGEISMMGYDRPGAHFDAFLKLRFGWIVPNIISPSKYREILHLGPIYYSNSNCILIIPDKIGYPDEVFLLEVRLSNSFRWDGRSTLFDKSLSNNQQGLFIYHINTLEPSNSEPRIDLEGDQAISGSNLVAFNINNRNIFTREDSTFYDQQNSGLVIKIQNVNNDVYELEISWEYERGTGEFNNLGDNGKISRLKSFEYWRKTWHTILSGSFGRSGHTDLLFYDKDNGAGEFYTTDGRGNIQKLGKTHNGWRKTWHTILGGSFGRSGHTDLLFYDKDNGAGEFYTTDGRGNIQKLGKTHNGWRKTWHTILGGSFGRSGHTDLLFYDKDNGAGEFYTTDGRGNIQKLGKTHNGWRKTWHTILGGSFGRSGHTDLLFYDKDNGAGEFYTTDGRGNIQKLGKTHNGWRKTWDIVLTIDSQDDRLSKILFYDSFHGHLEIYQATGNGDMTYLYRETNVRRSWDLIVGNISLSHQNSSILFYDKGI